MSAIMSHSTLPGLLIRESLVTAEQILGALDATRGTDVTWLEQLLASGVLDENELSERTADVARLQRCEPQQLSAISPDVLDCIPADIAIEHRVIPLGIDGDGYLRVAMVDPTDDSAVEEIGFFAGRPVLREVASATALACALHHYYGARTLLWPRQVQRAVTAPSYAMAAAG